MTKYFTYVSNVKTGRNNRYSGVVRHSAYRSRSGSPALLLHTTDDEDPITDDDVASFAKSAIVKDLYPSGVMAVPSDHSEGDWLITGAVDYVMLPDQATIDTGALRVITDGGQYEIDLRKRYNDCRSLLKAVGCSECPERGMTCLKRSVPAGVTAEVDDIDLDEDKFKETFKNRITTIGAFQYISPTLTIPEDHHFVPSFRHYEDHDFTRIESNGAKISKRNQKTAQDRKFRRHNCTVCPVQDSCKAFRSCSGPYPVEEEVTKQLLQRWDAALKQGPFTPWQFWAIARAGGADGTYRRNRYSRFSVRLHGLRYSRSSFETDGLWSVSLWRDKVSIGEVTRIDNYATLREIFEELPSCESEAIDQNMTRPSNDKAVALYLMLTAHRQSRRYRSGWGGDNYGILYKRLQNESVKIHFSGPRYLRYPQTISNYGEFFENIDGDLTVPKLAKRDGLRVVG